MEGIKNFFIGIWNDFDAMFFQYDYYKLYLKGLKFTIIIAIIAALIGLLIGVVVTAIRLLNSKNKLVKVVNKIANLYVTIIRGTPVVLQLFIGYFVIFSAIKSASFFGMDESEGVLVAGLVFGINSGAYMAEILRGGIMSVDKGQMEAGRSLGLSWMQTFLKIVLPQALKIAIPTIFNEFITLVKETSVAGYVGVVDLMKIRQYIMTQTAKMYMPLFIIAIIYLIVVLGLQAIQKLIENKFARSER